MDQDSDSHDDSQTGKDSKAGKNGILGGFADYVATWQGALTAIAALVSTAATSVAVVFKNWVSFTLTLALMVAVGAVYIKSIHREFWGMSGRALRWSAIGALIVGPIAIVLALMLVAIVNHNGEVAANRTSIAIAQFDGPDLPPPYEKCRPSDMLTDKLDEVGNDYHRLAAFELPYVVKTDGRWAGALAQLHLQIEGADTLVYGEYSTYRSTEAAAAAGDESKPDSILISPQVESSKIPEIPLLWKSSSIRAWAFQDQRMRIAELCSGSERSVAFLADAKRIGYALAGLELARERRFKEAESALDEAQPADGLPAMKDDKHVSCARAYRAEPHPKTGPALFDCSGVLSFYLAALQERFGLYDAAVSNYEKAAEQLHDAAAYIDRANIQGNWGSDGSEKLQSLRNAVASEPTSIEALADLSEFRWEYGSVHEADVYLDRAFKLIEQPDRSSPTHAYALDDAIAVARAFEQRSVVPKSVNTGDRIDWAMFGCAVRELDRFGGVSALLKSDDQGIALDYSGWLLNASYDPELKEDERTSLRDRAFGALHAVLERDPFNPLANRKAALYLSKIAGDSNESILAQRFPLGQQYYLERAYAGTLSEFAQDDNDFVEHGNAAHALGLDAEAERSYTAALRRNPNSFFAHYNLANLYLDEAAKLGSVAKRRLAFDELRQAHGLHPFDRDVIARLQALHFAKLSADVTGDPAASERKEAIPAALPIDRGSCRFTQIALHSGVN